MRYTEKPNENIFFDGKLIESNIELINLNPFISTEIKTIDVGNAATIRIIQNFDMLNIYTTTSIKNSLSTGGAKESVLAREYLLRPRYNPIITPNSVFGRITIKSATRIRNQEFEGIFKKSKKDSLEINIRTITAKLAIIPYTNEKLKYFFPSFEWERVSYRKEFVKN